ncbi:MAG TPA: YIP1 family protein [Candidatus Dormibacteraeota bacterium]|nr:YIP1 family protein [Candidatus Dormibacteraeota bacterium]
MPPSQPPPIGPTSGPIVARIAAALFLRRDFYARAAADPRATGPAGAIVCLVALARESVVIYEVSQVSRVWGVIVPILVLLALIAWLLIGTVAWVVTRPLRTPPDFRRLLRCLGFAQTPTMMLATLASVSDPTLYLIAYAALMLWALVGVAVALRAAAETTTGWAVLLALPVFIVQFALLNLSRILLLG